MEMKTGAECIVLDQAENKSLLGLKFGALINLEKSVSQIAVIERPIFHYRRQTCGPASIELLSAQSSASSHGGKCSLQTRRRSSTYRLILRARAFTRDRRAITARCWAITRG